MAANKTIVLITGANQGIGFETAQILSHSPKYHVLLGSRSLERGNKAVTDLQGSGLQGSVSMIQIDVSNDASIQAAATAVETDFGRLDVLVNNAGIVVNGDLSMRDTLRQTFETNTFGAAAVTEAFVPLLRKSTAKGGARLLFLSSGLGSIALAADPTDLFYAVPAMAYRASKAAMNMMMVSYAKSLGGGVKVFAICPGFLATNLSGSSSGSKARGAGEPVEGGRLVSDVVEGRRDGDAGKFVCKDGVNPW